MVCVFVFVCLATTVWSNGNMKHVQAAGYMDITVVSPLWVEQCRESCKIVPTEDFLVSPEDTARTIPSLSLSRSKDQEPQTVSVPIPVAHVADAFDDADMFSSSQRIQVKNQNVKANKVGVIKNIKSKKSVKKTDKAVQPSTATVKKGSKPEHDEEKETEKENDENISLAEAGATATDSAAKRPHTTGTSSRASKRQKKETDTEVTKHSNEESTEKSIKKSTRTSSRSSSRLEAVPSSSSASSSSVELTLLLPRRQEQERPQNVVECHH